MVKRKGYPGFRPGKVHLPVILLFLLIFSGSMSSARAEEVLVVQLSGEVNYAMNAELQGAVLEAEKMEADLLLIELNTTGGLVQSAISIKDELFGAGIPTAVLVEGRAWSAGALITLAAEKIAMYPGSSIGAAETRPNEEKYISALKEEFSAVAEARGRDPQIAAAMVDAEIAIPGIIERGKILTLTAEDAQEKGFCDYIVTSRSELLQEMGLAVSRVTAYKPDLKILFVGLITNPVIAGILLLLGLGGLMFEVVLPGFGASGTIGALALVLFFSGFLLVGSTSWILIALFALGLVLLLVEFLVIPGFGITGLGGLAAIGLSIFLSFPNPGLAIYALAITAVGLAVLFLFALKYIPESKIWTSRISLPLSQRKELGYVAPRERKELIGKTGKTITILRPAGTALISGGRVDVVSEGGFIERDREVEVVAVEGSKVIVREV
ncbi:MAG: NfeD family protein [Halanaerobium sp.]|nr:NfeD family protein [Halanaerobium sp.]